MESLRVESSRICSHRTLGEWMRGSQWYCCAHTSRHYIPGGTPEWPADKIEALMAEHCPLKRCATPEDVARVVAFLASDDGGWVNGTSSIQLHDRSSPANNTIRSSHHHLRWLFSVVQPRTSRDLDLETARWYLTAAELSTYGTGS
jgi:hypothetical protein